MRLLSAAVACGLVAGTVVAVGTSAEARAPFQMVGPASVAAGKAPGSYVSVTPFRAADATVAPGTPLKVTVGGMGGVPTSMVSAVAFTLSTSAPTVAGGLVAYADGSPVPATKNLLYQQGQSVAVAAISRVSATGVLDVTNVAASGHTHVTVDVAGYYVGGTLSDDPGGLHPLRTPLRRFDTRHAGGPVGAGQKVDPALGGSGGIPASGVGAVAVAITAVSPARTGTLTAWAAGTDRPSAPTVRFTGGQNYTGFAVVPTDDAGSLSIRNDSSGPTQIVVDVIGWTSAGVTRTPGTFQPRFPNRALSNAAVAANATKTVLVRGRGGLPLAPVPAVAVSITVTAPTRSGGLVAWAGGSAPTPSTTNLRFAAGQSAADFAIVPESGTGTITIRNQSPGTAHVWVDIVGFVSGDQLVPPDPSASHYVRNLQETDTDAAIAAKMGALGQADAAGGSTLVLLEFGAQTITPPRATNDPGVLLTGTTQRLTYAQVVTAVQGYIDGFRSAAPSAPVTIGVGTNNAGAYDTDANAYDPTGRGADWATLVIQPLRTAAPSGVTVRGANDIEASFDTNSDAFAHAQAWERAYLAQPVGPLIFNGSLDNCPDAFGVLNTTCTTGWTQAGYYSLAYGLDPTRIVALPQVYTISQATQWTNVDASGGGQIRFIGALTERGACPAVSSGCPTVSLTAPNGWAALTRGLQTLSPSVSSSTVPAVTDLSIDQ